MAKKSKGKSKKSKAKASRGHAYELTNKKAPEKFGRQAGYVYGLIKSHGPLTAAEIAAKIDGAPDSAIKTKQKGSIVAAFWVAQLKNKGLIRFAPKAPKAKAETQAAAA